MEQGATPRAADDVPRLALDGLELRLVGGLAFAVADVDGTDVPEFSRGFVVVHDLRVDDEAAQLAGAAVARQRDVKGLVSARAEEVEDALGTGSRHAVAERAHRHRRGLDLSVAVRHMVREISLGPTQVIVVDDS